MIIETHCHLDYLKERELAETLRLSREAGVEKIITIGVDPDNLDTVLRLAENHAEIYFTQGIHPHDSKDATAEVMQKIRTRATHQKMVAVGEIGLDYHYNNSPPDIQRERFRQQLQIACDTNRPVVIHSRDADEDTIAILGEFNNNLIKKGVIHSFSSGLELAQWALDHGFYLGFNGMITFKKAENVRDAVQLCPIERLLVETDSPFLTPVPHRGKENAPFYLPFIIAEVAKIKGMTEDEVRKITAQNAKNLFGL